MPFTNAEKQRCFSARLLADPLKAAEYKMKRRQWRKKKEDGRHVSVVQHVTNYETSHARTVVRECCKGDDESKWERVKFDRPPPKNPLTDGHQNLRT